MRLRVLLRLFLVLLLTFVLQKVLFMLYNMGMADGAPFLSCLSSLWHGLRLDIATSCYLIILPTVVLIISLFFKRFPLRKVLMPYYVLVSVVLSLIFVADMVLYGFWGAKLDANDLIYAAKPKDMLASLPLWASVLAFVVVATITVGYVLLLRWVTPKILTRPQAKLGFLISHFSLLILSSGLIFLGMRGGVTESTANPSYAYFSQYPFCNHAALNPAFNMFHSLFKVQDLGSEFDSLPEEVVDTLLADAYEPDNTLCDTLLRLDRPNVLLIMWEGAGLGMVGSDSVAPNLHRYMREGISFTNCYANSYRTDRGILSVLSGWLGLPTTTLIKRTDLCRCLPSIAASLRNEGYSTSMTYGGDIDFTNMRLYFSETGFSSVSGSEAFTSDQRTSAWGVPDEHLLTMSLVPKERPFLATALTLSSHEPWEVPLHRLDDPKRNSFAYTDSCLGLLIDSLKATPLWDSLLIIVVPDHGIPYADGMPTSEVSVARIPMVWMGGALAKQSYTVDCLMSQSDLAATLLAQMRLGAEQFPFSRNVQGTTYSQRRQFVMHSDKNCLNLVIPEGCWFYDCVSHTLQPESSELQQFVEALLQRLYQVSATLSARK